MIFYFNFGAYGNRFRLDVFWGAEIVKTYDNSNNNGIPYVLF
ncbi:hypothetical Protein YC6258_00961 [Gynuella sunshinyii YC6258]|uniref:Uncharacterized protein n=1 Tax=Gynuella sunshinyii YC6258 TaxID=1445510 RepID=A0A0C5VFP5_9GAMM|nr:hypothetical Protein YC6258_00961 [Gynuella sunshinyii YC6258]